MDPSGRVAVCGLMCGVAGVWARGAGHDIWDVATRLGTALRHRGPDDAGWLAAWTREGRCAALRELSAARADESPPPDLVLAHRRLSIVDLATGWQPIANERGSIWIVYNGEIYNHLSVRGELESRGHRFTTRSDTEMVVHAYEEWDCDAFARFNGIFAFALWDAGRRRLVLARDPLGVKPLYVGTAGPGLWFASEVKAAIHAGLYVPEVNRAALDPYLAYRFVPSPLTLFRAVRRVPPGHWVASTGDGVGWTEPTRYAPMPAAQDESAGLAEWVERLGAVTGSAVAGQMMADVPVGALLSGGLDSSIVVAAMREQQPEPVSTYAIGFPGGNRESELDIARRSAIALGTVHHEVRADPMAFSEQWNATIRQIDEPIASPGHVLVKMLCKRVRQDLKVVLTGQGADEPLGGYLRHAVERWRRALGLAPVAGTLRLGAAVLSRREAVQRLAAVVSERDDARRIAAAFAVFSAEQRRALILPGVRAETPPDGDLDPIRRWLSGTEGLDPLNRLLFVDARLSLSDDLLLGADKVSMAHSVELRVPYLDLDYLAVAERIPGRFKITARRGRKQLQQLVGRRVLPVSLARDLAGTGGGWRRKRGFDVPADRWFSPSRLAAVETLLLGPGAAVPEYLDRARVAGMLREHSAGLRDHTRRLTALVTLEAWHRAFMGGDPASLPSIGPWERRR